MAIETGSALRTLLFQKITTKTFHLFHTHAPPLLSLAPAAQQPAWQRCTFPLHRAAQGGGSLSNDLILCLKAADTSGCYRPIKLMIACFIWLFLLLVFLQNIKYYIKNKKNTLVIKLKTLHTPGPLIVQILHLKRVCLVWKV